MANRTFVKLAVGEFAEERTVEVSAGAGDAGKIPNVGATGVLDRSVVNAVQTSAGAGDAGKVVALDSSGRMDSTMLPVGVGADSTILTTTEIIAAGAWVNVTNSSGAKVRNADASNGRKAHGFTLLGAGSGAACTVYFEGTNTAVSGKTPGAQQYLSATTPGASVETPPSAAAQIVQALGVAISATAINAEVDSRAVTLA